MAKINSIDDIKCPEDIYDIEVPENLEEIMRQKAKRKLSRDERRAQMISWVMGMMPRPMKMSREEVEKMVRERYG